MTPVDTPLALPNLPAPPIARLWQPYDGVEFRVRCERRLHRIRIDPQGRLVLVDHDLELEALAAALGGDEMRCPRVVDLFKSAVRSGAVGKLPDKIRPHLRAMHQRKEDRRAWLAERRALLWASPTLDGAAAGAPGTDTLDASNWALQRDKDAYRARHLRRLLQRSRLATAAPKGATPYATPHTVQVNWAAVQRISPGQALHLDVHGRQGFGNRTCLRGTIYLHEHWWARVHRAGLDVVDGRLVVDAPALGDDQGVLYSFAGMTPRARKRAQRRARTEPASADVQLALPDILGETRTATVCVLSDPLAAAYESDRWRLRLEYRWFRAVAERGAPWRLTTPVEPWRVPTS